ncbi:caspase-14-like [Megalops cyprinoides]|uniref:caspase-14-like n=1 Tax=Megalops cyprinoides TaxID=118141 RepID=UPI001864E689|nr:caspase-14-like [Megalops cyprinoides]
MAEMEDRWRDNMSNILSELDAKEYSKMFLYLDQIPKDKRGLDKSMLVEQILQTYGLQGSLDAMKKVLDKLPRNDSRIRQYLKSSTEDMQKCGQGLKLKRSQGDQPGPSNKKTEVAYDEGFVYNLSGRREAFILCQKKDRDGATMDRNIITKLLEKYSFDCTTKNDLKGEAIMPALKSFQTSLRSGGEVACCFIVLMAHGGEGVIDGIDRKQVPLKDIFALFNNKECPELMGKPKVFIIQACRGRGKDHGVESMVADDLLTEESHWAADSPIMRRMPTVSDTLTICPTLPGNVALRNETYGSPLFIKMNEVFEQFDGRYHLVDLFTKVNQELVKEDYEHEQKVIKITLCMDSSFTKALFLNR